MQTWQTLIVLGYLIGISAAVCPDGWSEYDETCYKVFGEIINYEEARVKCQEHGAELATPETSEENTAIEEILSDNYGNGKTLSSGTDSWLGARRLKLSTPWIWVNGQEVEEFDWLDGWSPDENDDNCLQTYRNGHAVWRWYTADCDKGGDNAYICQKRAGPEPDYIVYNDCTENMALWGHNTKFVTDVPTREACMQTCREETGFNCLSIDYRRWDKRCSLQNQNKHTRPNSYKIAYDESNTLHTSLIKTSWPGQDTFSYCTVKND